MNYPLIFGEVLFDQFADGSVVLGGAPFNVAWHLTALGCRPLMLSRIGQDPLGTRVQSAMQDWGMPQELLQHDSVKATGTVDVVLQQGQPSFQIVPDVAYDHIALPASLATLQAAPPALLYHGTLAVRAATSRDTLLTLRNTLATPVFMDINLRAPWWRQEFLPTLLKDTHWLKLNQDELQQLAPAGGDIVTQARALLSRYAMRAVIVTRGEEGAFVVTPDALFTSAPARVAKVQDTVGAGDGFSAIVITGILLNWDWQATLDRASEFAARICEQRGATIQDKDFYTTLMQRWQA